MKNTSKQEKAKHLLWSSEASSTINLRAISEEIFRFLGNDIEGVGGALFVRNELELKPITFFDSNPILNKLVYKIIQKPIQKLGVSVNGDNPIAKCYREKTTIVGSVEDFGLGMISKGQARKITRVSKKGIISAFPIYPEGVLIISYVRPLKSKQIDLVQKLALEIQPIIRQAHKYEQAIESELETVSAIQLGLSELIKTDNINYTDITKLLTNKLGLKTTISNVQDGKISKAFLEFKLSTDGKDYGFIYFDLRSNSSRSKLLQTVTSIVTQALHSAHENKKVREQLKNALKADKNLSENPSIKFTLRLTPSLNSNIELLASQRNQSKADYMRKLLQQGIDDEMGIPQKNS